MPKAYDPNWVLLRGMTKQVLPLLLVKTLRLIVCIYVIIPKNILVHAYLLYRPYVVAVKYQTLLPMKAMLKLLMNVCERLKGLLEPCSTKT